MYKIYISLLLCVTFVVVTYAQPNEALQKKIDDKAQAIEEKMIRWRQELHQFPELSNREFKTGKKIASWLRDMGIDVRYPVAKTGVVGVLRTGKPGPVVALRADIDGLPVVERVDLPYASKEKSKYLGKDVGVMHACGHDTHMAILLATAEVLSAVKSSLVGTVVFLFQPAEEGVPEGEEGGAPLMIKEGALKNPDPQAIFGLHISAQTPVGDLTFKPEGLLAAVDLLKIKVKGKQAHGSAPWSGVDPVVVSAQIINALQTIVSRQLDLTTAGVALTVATINGGVRNNIIPEEVNMTGTLRTLDDNMRDEMHKNIYRVVSKVGESMGAQAKAEIIPQVPVTYNSPMLTQWATPVMKRVAGEKHARIIKPITGGEDFSFYAKEIPAFFFFVGGMPIDDDPSQTASHHSPDFFIDESGLITGLRAMLHLTVNYLYNPPKE